MGCNSSINNGSNDPGRRPPGNTSDNEDINVRPPDPNDTKTLKVEKVDFNIRENTKQHNTFEFDITDKLQGSAGTEYLVVRRGQPFDLTIFFNRKYDPNTDDLRIVFDFGKKPLRSKHLHEEFKLSAEDTKKEWGAWIKSTDTDKIKIAVNSAANAVVGRWHLSVHNVKENRDVVGYSNDDPIYILFNPWNRDDAVYLHDKALRQEYVMEESGAIWQGSAFSKYPRPWVFGQFTGNVLDCSLDLLDRVMGSGSARSRGDPVEVTRIISQVVNVQDENGILTGNWSGNYGDGTSPLAWSGSLKIFEQYFKTKKPVSYGQCWVFSGLTTTMCRALGIPCRSITNFASAHDTNGSLTIDEFYTEDNEEQPSSDSVWNYHCWNDAWMARPDLPEGYGGWQAIDATPQERSGGVFACGPVSLAAIRKGELWYPYDAPFVYAEVNADICQWVIYGPGSARNKTLSSVKTSRVGMNISTRKPGTENDREDITKEYKFPEHSEEERIANDRALQVVHRRRYDHDEDRDVFGEVKYDEANTYVGMDMEVVIVISNKGSEPRTVSGTCKITSMYYTGVLYKPIKQQKIPDTVIAPNSKEEITLKLSEDQYFDYLTDHCYCIVSAMYNVQETEFAHVDSQQVRLRKPDLVLQAGTTAKKGVKYPVQVTFTNPLGMSLTNVEIVAEGPGLTPPKTFKQSNIGAKEDFKTELELVPSKTGVRELVLTLHSNQLSYIPGSLKVAVSE